MTLFNIVHNDKKIGCMLHLSLIKNKSMYLLLVNYSRALVKNNRDMQQVGKDTVKLYRTRINKSVYCLTKKDLLEIKKADLFAISDIEKEIIDHALGSEKRKTKMMQDLFAINAVKKVLDKVEPWIRKEKESLSGLFLI